MLKPKLTLFIAAAGPCNETRHDALVSSVNASIVGSAPAGVQDNIVVSKGTCTNVRSAVVRQTAGMFAEQRCVHNGMSSCIANRALVLGVVLSCAGNQGASSHGKGVLHHAFPDARKSSMACVGSGHLCTAVSRHGMVTVQ